MGGTCLVRERVLEPGAAGVAPCVTLVQFLTLSELGMPIRVVKNLD